MELSQAVYNGYALSLGGVALFTFGGVSTPAPIEGSFTAYLYRDWSLRLAGPSFQVRCRWSSQG